MGFARRFATWRAAMLFADPTRLARLLNDPARPVVIIFAGKAHPHDQPGQQLIRLIHDFPCTRILSARYCCSKAMTWRWPD